MIETRRLRLLPATLASLRAELEGPTALASLLGVSVPANWPPELYDAAAVEWTLRRLEAEPATAGWWTYYFVRTSGGEEGVVGCGGYKGPPNEEGLVEIGYSILPQHQRQGFATEAAAGLVRNAFTHSEVHGVVAETLPELVASIGVLEKCGFGFVGDGSEPGVIRYHRRRDPGEPPTTSLPHPIQG